MSHGALSEAERRKRATLTVAGVSFLCVAIITSATWTPGALIIPLSLLPIGAMAGALAGFILAGTIWYSGL